MKLEGSLLAGALANALRQAFPQLTEDVVAHSAEHALEVQLPFLQALAGDFSFVPITVGVGQVEVEQDGHTETGGAGFLGSHLCYRLLQDGDEVICLDNFFTGAHQNVEKLRDARFARDVGEEALLGAPGGYSIDAADCEERGVDRDEHQDCGHEHEAQRQQATAAGEALGQVGQLGLGRVVHAEPDEPLAVPPDVVEAEQDLPLLDALVLGDRDLGDDARHVGCHVQHLLPARLRDVQRRDRGSTRATPPLARGCHGRWPAPRSRPSTARHRCACVAHRTGCACRW